MHGQLPESQSVPPHGTRHATRRAARTDSPKMTRCFDRTPSVPRWPHLRSSCPRTLPPDLVDNERSNSSRNSIRECVSVPKKLHQNATDIGWLGARHRCRVPARARCPCGSDAESRPQQCARLLHAWRPVTSAQPVVGKIRAIAADSWDGTGRRGRIRRRAGQHQTGLVGKVGNEIRTEQGRLAGRAGGCQHVGDGVWWQRRNER